jgi:hypothetical protein
VELILFNNYTGVFFFRTGTAIYLFSILGRMKLFLRRLIFFVLPFGIAYVVYALYLAPKLITRTEGLSTQEQIVQSFRNVMKKKYDLIILGNSTVYRGINPDYFNMSAFNFAHDNDSFNQMYYKLLWLKEQDNLPNYLILGIDYFQFSFISDTRNYVYSDILDKRYLSDYEDSFLNYWLQKTNILEFSRMKFLRNVTIRPTQKIFQRENGQYIKPGKAYESDTYFYSIKRLAIQKEYFEKTLEFCRDQKITVFLCMQPTRKNALKNYKNAEILEFNDFIERYTNNKVIFLNYTYLNGYTVDDYTDITHLNENAANRYSILLNDTITKYLNLKKIVSCPSPSNTATRL